MSVDAGNALLVFFAMFGAIALVYVCARANPTFAQLRTPVHKVAFNFAMPLVIFWTLASQPLPDFRWQIFGAYYLPTVLLYFLVFFTAQLRFVSNTRCTHNSTDDGSTTKQTGANVLALATTYSNAIILGIPLVDHFLTSQEAAYYYALVAVHSPVLFTLTSVLHATVTPRTLPAHAFWQDTGRTLVFNPILMAIAAGLLWNQFGPSVPAHISEVFELLSSAAAPLAVLALGLGLAGHGIRGERVVGGIATATKLIVHPLLVAGCCLYVFDLPAVVTLPAILLAALPTGVNVYVFAVRFDAAAAATANTILFSTLAAAFTIGALILLAGNLQ